MLEIQRFFTFEEFLNFMLDLSQVTSFPTTKVAHSPSKKNCVIAFNENPLEIMKNAFYFISKALVVLKIFKCLS